MKRIKILLFLLLGFFALHGQVTKDSVTVIGPDGLPLLVAVSDTSAFFTITNGAWTKVRGSVIRDYITPKHLPENTPLDGQGLEYDATGDSMRYQAFAEWQELQDTAAAIRADIGTSASIDLPYPYARVLVIFGQSNAAGWALNSDLSAGLLAAQPHIQIYNWGISDNFEDLDIGTNNKGDGTGVATADTTHSIEAGLARYYQNFYPGDTLWLVKYGRDGSSLDTWYESGTSNYDQLYTYLNAALQDLIDAGRIPVLYFYMHQGEDGPLDATYDDKLDSMINNHRLALGSDLPFFLGQPAHLPADIPRSAFETRARGYDNVYSLYTRDVYTSIHYDAPAQDSIALKLLREMTAGAVRPAIYPFQAAPPVIDGAVSSTVTDFSSGSGGAIQTVFQGNHTDSTLNLANNKIFELDLTSFVSPFSLELTSPTNGEKYALHWYSNDNNTEITFPSELNCIDGSIVSTYSPSTSPNGVIEFYYNGTDYRIISATPSCVTGFVTEYQAILDYMTLNGITLPSDTLQTLQNTFVRTLITQGIWDNLDALYVPATETQRQAVINWKNPGFDSLVINSSPTFNVKRGFRREAGNGSLTLPDVFTNYTSSSANVSYYITDSMTVASTTGYFMRDETLARVQFVNNHSATEVSTRFSNPHIFTHPESTGFYGWDYTSFADADHDFFYNGVQQAVTFTSANSNAPQNPVSVLLADNGEGFAFLAVGGSQDGRNTTFYQAFETYRLAIGLAPQ